MARSHGRVYAAIWSDEEFIALDADAQRLYLFLLSQADLNHAGLLPLRPRRWAAKYAGGSTSAVMGTLDTLAEHRFVLVDEDTEEVLIRTLVRNDGVYKQPKVMVRMREDARQIDSPALRAAFAAEMGRLPLAELSGNAREVAERVAKEIQEEFSEAVDRAEEGVSGRVSGTHPDTHIRARAPVPQPPTPSPSKHHRPAAAPPDTFDAWWSSWPRKEAKAKAKTAYARAVKTIDPDELLRLTAEWFRRRPDLQPKYVPLPASWLNARRWEDEAPPAARPTTSPRDQLPW